MFVVDAMSRMPVYEQIVEQFERFILTGVLNGGDQVPSVRNLSMQLFVNPNTIQKAFSELDNRHLIVSVPGKGSFVSPDAPALLCKRKSERLGEITVLAEELALAGVPEDDVIEKVRQAYHKKTEGHNV